MMESFQSPDIATSSGLRRGDRAAESADWTAAVSGWEAALATSDRERAEARLRWFLDTAAPSPGTGRLGHRFRFILVGVAAAVVGTGLVLLAEHMSSPWRDVSAGVAWAFFIVASACSILFAYQYRASHRPTIDASDVARAHDLARQVNEASATMPTGPRLPT